MSPVGGARVKRARHSRLTAPSPPLQYRPCDDCPFFARRGRSALSDPHDTGGRGPSKAGLYVEDAIILLALVPLFVLTVFFRNTLWGQAGLVVVLLVMVVVFVRRLRRVHRAFTQRDEEEEWRRGGKE